MNSEIDNLRIQREAQLSNLMSQIREANPDLSDEVIRQMALTSIDHEVANGLGDLVRGERLLAQTTFEANLSMTSPEARDSCRQETMQARQKGQPFPIDPLL